MTGPLSSGYSAGMAYRVTLEIYVDREQVWPLIEVETQRTAEAFLQNEDASSSTEDTEALENVLSETREFAQRIQSRKVPVER